VNKKKIDEVSLTSDVSTDWSAPCKMASAWIKIFARSENPG